MRKREKRRKRERERGGKRDAVQTTAVSGLLKQPGKVPVSQRWLTVGKEEGGHRADTKFTN